MKNNRYTPPVTRPIYIRTTRILVGSVNTVNTLDDDGTRMVVDPVSADEDDIGNAI
jgi:hypothetical protein